MRKSQLLNLILLINKLKKFSRFKSNRQRVYAGIYSIGTDKIHVRAHSKGYAVGSCSNEVQAKLNVFAFRTHTHELGQFCHQNYEMS